MVKNDIRAELGSMLDRYGFETVYKILHEMEAGDTKPNVRGETGAKRGVRQKGRGRPKRRRSAVEYIQAMEVPPERATAVRRAAEEFERRAFLPTLSEVRIFYETYGIKIPRSKSRSSEIPRIFKFLVTMEATDLERMLDDGMFSGPVSLGPIADAIRGKAKEHREAAIGRT